jgi:hypothetical protein
VLQNNARISCWRLHAVRDLYSLVDRSTSLVPLTHAALLPFLLLLAAGQLEVGELLVQGMYAALPDRSACSQEQLLQLLL